MALTANCDVGSQFAVERGSGPRVARQKTAKTPRHLGPAKLRRIAQDGSSRKVSGTHRISPVDSKRIPPTEVPGARNSRILPRFAPETFVACAKTCTASDNAVPS